MTTASGLQDTFFVVRATQDGRHQVVDGFPSGQTALNDADQRFQDTGDDFSVFQGIGDATELVQQTKVINTIASGVIGQTFFTLPLQGDDATTTPLTVNNLSVARYQKNVAQETLWNLLSPLGGASGLEMRFSWFPNASQSAAGIKFKLTITQLSSGVDTSIASSISQELSLTDNWVENRLYIHNIELNSSIGSLENFGVKFQRLGSDPFDDFLDHTYLVSNAVRFNQ